MSIVDKYIRFLPVAQALATLSKNKGTKVGALILGPDQELRSGGWNGAPRGSKADEDERFALREERLAWTSHAENNAITGAARVGTPLSHSTILITHTPCMECAKMIVQAGIITVINPVPEERYASKWRTSLDRTRALFAECGIHHVEF